MEDIEAECECGGEAELDDVGSVFRRSRGPSGCATVDQVRDLVRAAIASPTPGAHARSGTCIVSMGGGGCGGCLLDGTTYILLQRGEGKRGVRGRRNGSGSVCVKQKSFLGRRRFWDWSLDVGGGHGYCVLGWYNWRVYSARVLRRAPSQHHSAQEQGLVLRPMPNVVITSLCLCDSQC